MSALSDLVDPLKREIAVPGEFSTAFPNTSNSNLLGSLADGFAAAQLDGFFGKNTLTMSTYTVAPDLSMAGAHLVVVYASEQILKSKLRGIATSTTYKAGPVEYKVDQSANVISQELKMIQTRKENLLKQILRAGRAANSVYVTDGYLTRSRGYYPVYNWGEFAGFYGWELVGFTGLAW